MILVEVARGTLGGVGRSGLGEINGITVSGHSGHAEHGKDIVCAAASVTIYTAAGALAEICKAPEQGSIIKDGYFELKAPDTDNPITWHTSQVIMETAYIGFKQIEASYPGYILITDNKKRPI